jgi:hypothetical protein
VYYFFKLKNHFLMKKLFVVIGATLVLLSCSKEAEITPQQSLSATSASAYRKAAKADNQEFQTLIRKWTEWAYGRPLSEAPFNDPNGSWQGIAQPYSNGIFMLAGAAVPDLIERTVTIRLSQYQYIFVPLVVVSAFGNECIPFSMPHGGQKPEAFFQSILKSGFNGPKELSLVWDGASLLSTKQKDTRANSGVWSVTTPPFLAEFYPCAEGTLGLAYSDGYWAKIPLTLGTHTLTVGGNFESGKLKWDFSNIVEYTIYVIP